MAHYRSWGLQADRGIGWWHHAACQGRTQMFFTSNRYTAGQAVHLCRAHCPVLRQCAAEALRLIPIGAVAGGTWYTEAHSGKAGPRKHQPEQLGCGPWCAHLRQAQEEAAK